MHTSLQNNFIGARSYEEKDKEIFFGREIETDELFQLININRFTLLYGKSGLGKTSVLQAGLFPKLRMNNYLPIYVRPNYRSSEADFVKDVENIVLVHLANENIIKEEIKSKETLWEYFHRAEFLNQEGKKISIVLVFDQFEEIFTLGTEDKSSELRNNTEKLVDFLSDIIENSPPTNLSESERLELQYKYDLESTPAKIIFSFREEYLGDFYSLSKHIPSIAYSNLQYKLCPLTFEKAYQIVKKASADLFEHEAIVETLKVISEAKDEDEAKKRDVDSFLLSIFCENQIDNLNSKDEVKISAKKIKKVNVQNIVDEKYRGILKELDLNVSERRLLEERLLSPEGYRWPVYLDIALSYAQVIGEENVREEKINGLANSKILKRYSIDGRRVIEIIHDKYASAVQATRDFRIKAEKEQLQVLQDQEDLRRKKIEDDLRLGEEQARLDAKKIEEELKLAQDRDALHLQRIKQEETLRLREQRSKRRLKRLSFVVLSSTLLIIIGLLLLNKSSINVIQRFSENEERKILKDLQKSKSPYAALVQASNFQGNIERNIYNKFFLFSPFKLARLKQTLDAQLREAFNVKPFYSIADLQDSFPVQSPWYNVKGGVLYTDQQDSLVAIDYVHFKRGALALRSNLGYQLLKFDNERAGIHGSSLEYGAQVMSYSNISKSHLLLLKDTSLFLCQLSPELSIVGNWKLKMSPNILLAQEPTSISLDERFVFIQFTNSGKAPNGASNRYFILPTHLSYGLEPAQLEFEAGETLLNMTVDSDGNIIAFTQKIKSHGGFWGFFASGTVDLKKYTYTKGMLKKSVKVIFSKILPPDKAIGGSRYISSQLYVSPPTNKFVFFRNSVLDKWSVFDLSSASPRNELLISGLIEKPFDIFCVKKDTIIISENFNSFFQRENGVEKEAKFTKIFGIPANQNTKIRLTSVFTTNLRNWLTVNVVVDNPTPTPFCGLLDLTKLNLYLLEGQATETSIYVRDSVIKDAIIVKSRQQNRSVPIVRWFFAKTDSIENIDEIKKWAELYK